MGFERTINKTKKLSKIAMNKASTTQTHVITNVDTELKKINTISQSFGITFDENNNILVNQLINRIIELENKYESLLNTLENHYHSYTDINGNNVLTKDTTIVKV